jgi:hypothetical protein
MLGASACTRKLDMTIYGNKIQEKTGVLVSDYTSPPPCQHAWRIRVCQKKQVFFPLFHFFLAARRN